MNTAVQEAETSTEVALVPTSAITPAEMLDRALSSNAGIEVINQLMTLHERWEVNQARKAFDNAIADAKSEIPTIVKNATVDYTSNKGRTNYKYETLGGIAKIIDPILSGHGLSYRFRSRQEHNQLAVTCIVAHRDGYFEETTLSGPPDPSGNKNAYQAVGSAATYLQRYTLKLALGLSADKDDDGNAAQQSEPQQQQRPPEQQQKPASKGQDARAAYSQHVGNIRNAQSREDLRTAWHGAVRDQHIIPADWQKNLIQEKNAKLKEIEQAEIEQQFNEEIPSDAMDMATEAAAPIEAEEFLDQLAFEMGQASSLDEIDEIWDARVPLDVLTFPPDKGRAETIRENNRVRLGGAA